MRTNIDLDDKLMQEAMSALKQTTKKGTVEQALRLAVQFARQQKAFDALYGAGWEGDLDEMRRDWAPNEAAE